MKHLQVGTGNVAARGVTHATVVTRDRQSGIPGPVQNECVFGLSLRYASRYHPLDLMTTGLCELSRSENCVYIMGLCLFFDLW